MEALEILVAAIFIMLSVAVRKLNIICSILKEIKYNQYFYRRNQKETKQERKGE